MDNVSSEIKRLNFEDALWLIFIFLSILNIMGDSDDKKYVQTHDNHYKLEANHIFTFTVLVGIFIYLYFLIRNIHFWNLATNEQKPLFKIKVIGSIFLLIGSILLFYFQKNQTAFIGSPAV